MRPGSGAHGADRRGRGQPCGAGTVVWPSTTEALVSRAISIAIGVLAAVFLADAGPSVNADRWRVLYFYDELKSSLVINDFKFLNAERGVAAGFLVDSKGKIKPTALTTDDGGAHWSLSPLKEVPISLFFLRENRGWMVGDKSIWQS